MHTQRGVGREGQRDPTVLAICQTLSFLLLVSAPSMPPRIRTSFRFLDLLSSTVTELLAGTDLT